MKKIISILILTAIAVLVFFTIILATSGMETERFNNIISKKISKTNSYINLKLTTIKFKLDIKEMSLFLETSEPEINYRDITIPTKKIKVYIDFASIIKTNPKIKKINLSLEEMDIEKIKKLSIAFKPSNFTSFVNNKIKEGKLNTELEVYLDDNYLLKNYIARGTVKDFKAEVIKNINLEETNFSFFADKTDVIIKNIFGKSSAIKIIDGDLKLELFPEILIESNFYTEIKYNNKSLREKNLLKDFKYINNIIDFEAVLNNRILINFDKTYKVKKYNYTNSGKVIRASVSVDQKLGKNFLKEKLNKLSIVDSEIKTNISPKKKNTIISGKYSFNKDNLLSFNFENIIAGDLLKFKLNANYDKVIKADLINYHKPKDTIANFSINLVKQKDNISIKNINFAEGKNSIVIENIKINKGKFLSLKKVFVKTSKGNKINNDFSILYGDKILIKGKQFDASNLSKFLNQKSSKNNLSHINKDIEIDFVNILAPLSEELKNFKLIGIIEKGKFTKISSKGDFGENNFLDITMKKDQNTKKKYLEVYSDLTKPLLSEYSFFKGLTGGKLIYSSIIEGDNSVSKLKIENFKVINAPGMVKLLSLADLGGLADLSEGDGLSFDILEINMEKNKDSLKLNEILAVGPSVSVLMEGYQNSTVTSLRGTLIPAKTLNNIISKIPVIGNIVIPKEVGEGLFGISFKMKGPPGKIKTTINPIRTITPRFIQKIIDKKKLNNFN